MTVTHEPAVPIVAVSAYILMGVRLPQHHLDGSAVALRESSVQQARSVLTIPMIVAIQTKAAETVREFAFKQNRNKRNLITLNESH